MEVGPPLTINCRHKIKNLFQVIENYGKMDKITGVN